MNLMIFIDQFCCLKSMNFIELNPKIAILNLYLTFSKFDQLFHITHLLNWVQALKKLNIQYYL